MNSLQMNTVQSVIFLEFSLPPHTPQRPAPHHQHHRQQQYQQPPAILTDACIPKMNSGHELTRQEGKLVLFTRFIVFLQGVQMNAAEWFLWDYLWWNKQQFYKSKEF